MSHWRAGKSDISIGTSLATFTPIASIVLAFALASSTAFAGDLDRVFVFDIHARSLDKALLQFGAQTHLQISFAWNLTTARLQKYELKGTYTGKGALAAILQGTRLTYVEEGQTVEILPPPSADSSYTERNHKLLNAQPAGKRQIPDSRVSKSPDPPARTHHAQSGELPRTLSEIVVTAQKYSQRAFDVPISLDVVSGVELRRLEITSLNDLQYDVPGLYVVGGNVYNYVVLRGVSNESGNGALVGAYIDEADISAEGYAGEVGYGAGNLQLYDLARVEVLKGPQGTLYGDGAMGGVIRYITNKPALTTYEMNAAVAAMFTQYGAPSQRTEVMVNVPLVSNTLALRIAGQFQHEGGWVDEPAADLKNVNDSNLTDVRLEALWQATPYFKTLLTQAIHRENYGIGLGENAAGDVIPVYGVTFTPNGEQSFSLSNLTVTAELPAVQLLSSSSYLTHSEENSNLSYVFGTEVELQKYLPISNRTFSEELRLHNTSRSTWHWTLGAFYQHYQDSNSALEYVGLAGPLSGATLYNLLGGSENSSDRAVFADTNVEFLKRFTLGAGVRYFKSDFRTSNKGVLIGNFPVVPPAEARKNFSSTDPRFYLQYHLSSNVNTYVSASKGFRSGEPNAGLSLGFNPESLWSYDLGTKVRFLANRLSANFDVFYEKYSNYVGEGLVTVDNVPEFGSFNIGEARIKGADADVSLKFDDHWDISGKGELVSSKFATILAGDTGFTAGERVPFVPGYTFTGSVEREFEWAHKPGFAQLNYSQTGSVRGYTSPVIQSDVIRFLSFKMGIRWNRNLQLAFFSQNLTNDRGHLDPNWNEAAAYRPRPRSFGAEFDVTFD